MVRSHVERLRTWWAGLGLAATPTLIRARVDDTPLVLAQLERLGVQPLRDEPFATHGNGVGLRLGWVTVIWVTHILSQADHRLNHVAPWAELRLHPRRGGTGQPVPPLDVSDDRLAAVLGAVSDETRGGPGEGALTPPLRCVYDLPPERVRLDSTTASGYWTGTEDGLCPFGPSKDQRPDLPQVKVMGVALEPVGWPVATEVVPGQRADDPLYLPASACGRESLGRRGLLYVGDGKMGAVDPQACIEAGRDFYLCPLSESQLPPAALAGSLAWVWAGEQALTPIYWTQANGPQALLAEGTERLREAVQELTLTSIRDGRRRRSPRTPLSRVPRHLLALLDFPMESYPRLGVDLRNPPYKCANHEP
jgi:hypothetical protein